MSEMVDFLTTTDRVPGIGPKKKEALERLNVRTLRDLVYHFPREYEDLRHVMEISSIGVERKALVRSRVLMVIKGKGYGRKRTLRLLTEDKSGRLEIIFFMGGYMEKTFVQGHEYFFYGSVKTESGRSVMFHPTFMPVSEVDELGIMPIYPLTKGISQKELRKYIKYALKHMERMPETLPEEIIKKKNLCAISYALGQIHFPENEQKFKEARYRLIYEELFDIQIALQLAKERFGKGRGGICFDKNIRTKEFTDTLPYTLTGAQARVLSDVEADMESDRAMNRLVQGDVGSGKTVIAQAAIFKASKSGFQSAYMAPTELLARQHFKTLSSDLEPLGIRVGFISGSLSEKSKKEILNNLNKGTIDTIVGTHAILSEHVAFANLGLVITDEQHRFGVNQRLLLSAKGRNPDILVMTATPIPRTLAVILYGDLDISIIDEMPPGRIPIETRKFTDENREAAYKILFSEIQRGHQAYVVAPLIEDSDEIDGRSAQSLVEDVRHRFPGLKVDLLYGSMKQEEKDAVMNSFYAGITNILVSTVVIEVGIHVQNATVMIIENAERFGLAQMHQLRGRVGRGDNKSYCLIIIGTQSDIAVARADALCSTNDGFIIAEKDLAMRGPGEVFGLRQHGLPELKIADLSKHMELFMEAREDAAEFLAKGSARIMEEHFVFSRHIKEKFDAETSFVL